LVTGGGLRPLNFWWWCQLWPRSRHWQGPKVRDPALRAAVAHELKNEGDLSQTGSAGHWADLARSQSKAAELGQRERSLERDHGLEL